MSVLESLLYAAVRTPLSRGKSAVFVARAEELAEPYGERFTPPASLRDKATSGGTYEEVQQ